jgi:hypothetical protein
LDDKASGQPRKVHSLAESACYSEPDLYNPRVKVKVKDPLLTHPLIENLKRSKPSSGSCNSLPDLEEEDNTSDYDAPPRGALKNHRRKNSLSMPDLREGAPQLLHLKEPSNLLPARLAKHPSQTTIQEEESTVQESRTSSRQSRRDSNSLPDLRDCDLVSQTYTESSSDGSTWNEDEEEAVFDLNEQSLSKSYGGRLPPQKTLNATPQRRHLGQHRSTETLDEAGRFQAKGRLHDLRNGDMMVRGEALPGLINRPSSRGKNSYVPGMTVASSLK